MAEERYSKIFALSPQKAAESDCVIVEAGALLNDNKENVKIKIKGRHDACVAVRAVPCIESAVAIAILDEVL